MRRRRIAVASAFAALVACTGSLWWAGGDLTRPAHGATGVPPADLKAQPIRFASESGGQLSAWFIPGLASGGAVLLLHSIRADKRSMLARARFFNREGYAALLVDLQAHGESEGERITFGYREAMDARAALRKLRELAPGEKIAALGVSLGAAALTLSGEGDALSAVVLESLYPTIDEAIEERLRLRLGAFGPPLAPLLLMQFAPRLGFDPSQLRPIERIALWRTPVLVLHGTEDRHTTLAQARRLYAAASEPKAFYAFPGAAHVDLHAFDQRAYEERVAGFLGPRLRGGG